MGKEVGEALSAADFLGVTRTDDEGIVAAFVVATFVVAAVVVAAVVAGLTVVVVVDVTCKRLSSPLITQN